jgi:hypothetical protein
MTLHRPRDSRGWRIPREGTHSRRIYDLLITGKGRKEIYEEIKTNYTTIGVLIWRIKHPAAHNAISNNHGILR